MDENNQELRTVQPETPAEPAVKAPQVGTAPEASTTPAANAPGANPAPTYSYTPYVDPPFVFKKVEVIGALVSYLLATLYVWAFLQMDQGLATDSHGFVPEYRLAGQLLFTVCYFGGIELLARAMGKAKASGETVLFGVCALLIQLAATLNRQRAVGGLGYTALHGIALLWPMYRAGILTGGGTGGWTFLDSVIAAFVLPFSNFILRIRTLLTALFRGVRARRQAKPNRRDYRLLPAYLLAVLLAVFGLWIAISLLGEADDNFAEIFRGIGRWFESWPKMSRGLRIFWFDFCWGIPVGMYLYGLAAGSLRREKPMIDARQGKAGLEKARVYPGTLLAVLVIVFLAVYALFIALQTSYLFGALAGQLPEGFTYAAYARRGFFELCSIMALNFLLFACCSYFYREAKRPALLQAALTALLVMSLLFAVTALSKLVLYIRVYGFTPLRLQSFWAILVLMFGTGACGATLVTRCRPVRLTAWFAAVTFTLLCFY